MGKIGIFFATDTGNIRLGAKKIHSYLGEDLTDKLKNINRIKPAELFSSDALIPGIQSYDIDDLPGVASGHQERFAVRFARSIITLYQVFYWLSAEMTEGWSKEGDQFEYCYSIIDERFVGLLLDQRGQPHLMEERIKTRLEQVTPQLQTGQPKRAELCF